MGIEIKYRFCRADRWSLWVLPEHWGPELWKEILGRIGDQSPADRPLIQRFSLPTGAGGSQFYLKIYGRSGRLGGLKDLARDSKAFRALKQGEALSECGFHVPLTVAAGEERNIGVLKRAFLLTLGISGSLLPRFILEHYSPPLNPTRLRRKREHLRRLAREIRGLHQKGFVHGDLVPYNIFVQAQDSDVIFFYLDNDRTRRYPPWFRHGLWRRNLVQLNRFVLPGISLQDRMRFLRHYLGDRPWGIEERRLIRWLETKTRKRWTEWMPQRTQVSFRKLMQWDGPFTKNTQE